MQLDKNMLDYLETQRVCVLAVEMPDGSPHGATAHFAFTVDPLTLYFETCREYRKAEALFFRKDSRASVVVGVDEKNMKTLQLDGTVRLIGAEQIVGFDEKYFGRFPEKKEKMKDEKYLRFVFVPHWWRFTDWTQAGGKKVVEGGASKNMDGE